MDQYSKDKEIERAITFLACSLKKFCRNKKPVLLHSIRVAFYLESKGYDKDIIIAAILHDLLEDSNVTSLEIKREFGKRVAGLVVAETFDDKIKDRKKRYREIFDRCLKSGKDALIIKAADILDNSNYYYLVKNKPLYQELIEKVGYFLKISHELLKDEPVYKDLSQKHQKFISD